MLWCLSPLRASMMLKFVGGGGPHRRGVRSDRSPPGATLERCFRLATAGSRRKGAFCLLMFAFVLLILTTGYFRETCMPYANPMSLKHHL